MNWRIFRPGQIYGDSVTGAYPHAATRVTGLFYDLFKTAMDTGVMPEAYIHYDVVPVDYVSRGIIALSAGTDNFFDVYHLTNPDAKSFAQVMGLLREIGYPIELLPEPLYKQKLRSAEITKNGKAYSSAMLKAFRRWYFISKVSFYGSAMTDCEYTRAKLEQLGVSCAPLDRRLIETYVHAGIREGYFRGCGRLMMKWWGWGDPKITFPMADKPNLWPWIAKKLGVVSTAPTAVPVDLESIHLPPTRASTELLAELHQMLRPEQITLDPLERLLHTYGKSFPDLFRVRNAVIRRAPDAVLFPDSHEQVEALVQLAQQRNFCLIPFGGGTNIVGGINPEVDEPRPMLTLSLRNMNRLISIDTRIPDRDDPGGSARPQARGRPGGAGSFARTLSRTLSSTPPWEDGWPPARRACSQTSTAGSRTWSSRSRWRLPPVRSSRRRCRHPRSAPISIAS